MASDTSSFGDRYFALAGQVRDKRCLGFRQIAWRNVIHTLAEHTMKRLFASFLALTLIAAAPGRAQTASDLFQQGLRSERADGDLKSAIAIYQRLIREHPSDRSMVARALIQLGGAFERMGSAEARAAYARVLRDYPEQSAEASLARTRLAALAASSRPAPRTDPTVRRIWAGVDVDALGAPTMDGQALTYVDWSTGDLAVRDLVAGTNRRLTNKGSWASSTEFALSSVPSPDAKRVAYSWFGRGQDLHNVEIRVIGMDGTGEKTVYSSATIRYVTPWEWTRDGRQILASFYGKDGAHEIGLVGTDSSRRVLKTLPAGEPYRVSLSPDGKVLAYDNSASQESRQHDLFLLNVETGAESVVAHPATDLLVGWTPDGMNVIFASDRTGNMSLWMLPVRNGIPAQEPQLLRRDAEFTMYPMAVTSNGSLYYSADASPTDLFVAEIDASTGRVTAPSRRVLDRYVGENRNSSWSPDGKSIVYVSKRQPGPSATTRILVTRNLTDGSERVIRTPISLVGSSAPRFWHDGKSIVVGGTDQSGKEGFFQLDPETGSATLLFAPSSTSGQFAGVVDSGRAVIYLHRNFQSGQKTFVRHSLTDSQTTDIYGYTDTKRNMWAPAISADGKWITFAEIVMDSIGTNSRFVNSIKVVSTGGGESREVARAPGNFGFGNLVWSPDGRHIYFTRNAIVSDGKGGMTSDTNNEPVLRVPFAGGPLEETGIVADEIQALRFSPDGTRITYTAGRPSLEVWVMENFLPNAAVSARPRPK